MVVEAKAKSQEENGGGWVGGMSNAECGKTRQEFDYCHYLMVIGCSIKKEEHSSYWLQVRTNC